MANNENECSGLKVVDYYTEHSKEPGFDPLQKMLDMQKYLQEEVIFKNVAEFIPFKDKKFGDMTLYELKSFLMDNEHSLVDELHELLDALGGVKDGIKSAGWKYWKKDNAKITNMSLDSLSANDLKELQFEAIDAHHFSMNVFLSTRLDSKQIYNMYMSKHAENIDRQERGY